MFSISISESSNSVLHDTNKSKVIKSKLVVDLIVIVFEINNFLLFINAKFVFF
jgi:hypothetical protein